VFACLFARKLGYDIVLAAFDAVVIALVLAGLKLAWSADDLAVYVTHKLAGYFGSDIVPTLVANCAPSVIHVDLNPTMLLSAWTVRRTDKPHRSLLGLYVVFVLHISVRTLYNHVSFVRETARHLPGALVQRVIRLRALVVSVVYRLGVQSAPVLASEISAKVLLRVQNPSVFVV